ncbi:sensor histidine kinase [Enterococcus sp. HY326]|uniref:sensor histidine kinase n=1 Tax=Enterococcus sp. HY326 TaxID=2971265 RepID=UPI00223F12B5|nr:histidine kinase [Enterococcus sp. HY326]
MKQLPYQNIWENSFFLLFAVFLLVGQVDARVIVLWLLVTLILCGLIYLKPVNFLKEILVTFFLAVGLFYPLLFVFLPTVTGFYLTVTPQKKWQQISLVLISVTVLLADLSSQLKILVLLLMVASSYLAWHRLLQTDMQQNYLRLKDDSWEQQHILTEKNSQLLSTQEQLIELEITKERNRIARDIHDNVGHLLSSALLQLGAIQTLNQQETLQQPLSLLNDTVNQGMSSIRNSVHNTYQISVTLADGLQLLLQDFYGAEVKVSGNFQDFPQEYAQPLLMIIKEALANVMKHSNADTVRIEFSQLPAFYKCTIQDNGTLQKTSQSQGIGLLSIQKRLEDFTGQLHTHASEKGFSLQVILPKLDKPKENEEEVE